MAITLSVTRVYDPNTPPPRGGTHTDPATPYMQQPDGLTGYGDPVFSDEFGGTLTVTNAGLGLVTTRAGGPTWATWYPDWPRFNAQSPGGNHTNTSQESYYATSKVSITGGELVLRADKTTTVAGLDYTSGMLTTKGAYEPLYGYFEARIKLDAVVFGGWPAWWMSASAFDEWPPEIDIWENFGGGSYKTNVYVPNQSTYSTDVTALTQTAYHTYGCLWTPSGVTFYRDGAQTSTTVRTPAAAQYLILNHGAQTAANPTFPASMMTVDYVRCWDLP